PEIVMVHDRRLLRKSKNCTSRFTRFSFLVKPTTAGRMARQLEIGFNELTMIVAPINFYQTTSAGYSTERAEWSRNARCPFRALRVLGRLTYGRPRERSNPMKWQWSVLVLALFTCSALAQEPIPGAATPSDPSFATGESPNYTAVLSAGMADNR